MNRYSVAHNGLSRARRVTVAFDEAHSEAWTIRPELAAAMQPHHPADSSYAQTADLLASRDFNVVALVDGRITDDSLGDIDVLVIAHPSAPEWEATTGVGSPRFDADELAAIHRFVARGGGLIVLGETEEAKYGANLDDVLRPYGMSFRNVTVQDYTHHHQAPAWILTTPVDSAHPLVHGVATACGYRAGALSLTGDAQPILVSSPESAPANSILMAALDTGTGRVVSLADSDLFGDDCLAQFDHEQLLLNTVYWAALPAFAVTEAAEMSIVQIHPAFERLMRATESLRTHQGPDGSVDLDIHPLAAISADVDIITASLRELAPLLPHDAEYLNAAADDLVRWRDTGCQRPDFSPSLHLLRPESHRADNVEHLIFFPMYAPNGTTTTSFEVLMLRGPWPEWLANLEKTRYNNAKFVPVHLLTHTSGYANECAVFFPETVSVTGPADNNFGAICCDREAERFRSVTGAAVQALRLNLPPEAQALMVDEQLTQDTFMLWDLIHDRAHSRGDLPFDPFMVRQRLPYWMYSLEELRCDLTSFVQAGELIDEFSLARHVQTAVILDRMLRFPITGGRHRNYDGLGGQVLFGFLHQRGIVRWTDNTLAIDWNTLGPAVSELLDEITALYRHGIDSSRVRYWIAAHDLIEQYVPAALASQWVPAARMVDAPDENDGKAWANRALDDEFPLNLFYRALQGHMAPILAARQQGSTLATSSVG